MNYELLAQAHRLEHHDLCNKAELVRLLPTEPVEPELPRWRFEHGHVLQAMWVLIHRVRHDHHWMFHKS
jgi:hypothetical protein